MEIKYQTIVSEEDKMYLIYKAIYLKGELKSKHLIYETKDSDEWIKMKKELDRSLK
jgi:hypothetical protein